MRRLAALVSVAVAATAIGGILSASGGAQPPGERTFKLIEQEGTFKLVDNPPRASNPRNPSLSVGDMFVFTSPVRSEANSPVGTVHAFCVVTRGGNVSRATSHCDGTYVLRDGTMVASAVLKGENSGVVAIVGGTGAYEGARGSITDRDLGHNRTEDTVHLLP